MITISVEKVKNRFDELIEVLKNSQIQDVELHVSVLYGALCVEVHTCKEQLKLESRSDKKKLMKNLMAINVLDEVEQKMKAMANGLFKEIKESVYSGFETFSKLKDLS